MHIIKSVPYGQMERIKELMKNKIDPKTKKCITQEKLASAIGVDKSNVNKWFKQGVKIRKNNLLKIAEYLNCDLEFLTCEQDIPRKSKGSKIKLASNKTELCLYTLKQFLTYKKHSFDYNFYAESDTYDVYEGYYVEDNVKYIYEAISENYDGEHGYIFNFNNENIKVSSEKATKFIDDIESYIAFKIIELKK